jgi:hypothetical protein
VSHGAGRSEGSPHEPLRAPNATYFLHFVIGSGPGEPILSPFDAIWGETVGCGDRLSPSRIFSPPGLVGHRERHLILRTVFSPRLSSPPNLTLTWKSFTTETYITSNDRPRRDIGFPRSCIAHANPVMRPIALGGASGIFSIFEPVNGWIPPFRLALCWIANVSRI